MNFETAFAHYQAHTATAEETALVERELEKYRLIEDYLAEQELPELPEDAAAAASAETKAVKRRLNRRTRNIVLISTAAVLAVVLLLQLVVSPLLNRRVYTDGLVDGSGYPTFDVGMSALAGLYMPLGDYYGSYAEHSGFMRDTLHLTFYDRTGSNRTAEQRRPARHRVYVQRLLLRQQESGQKRRLERRHRAGGAGRAAGVYAPYLRRVLPQGADGG